jgi:ribosomal protein S18 acetylase RimI-like enzyme
VEEEFLEQAREFKLVYLFSPQEIHVQSQSIQLLDTKITFVKKLGKKQEEEEGIDWYKGELSGEIIRRALESGVYSRFKRDPRLVNGEFESLYQRWIKNAWEQKQILASPDAEALVTLDIEGDIAKIGLLAVAPIHQGKGWGKRLVGTVEAKAMEMGANQVLIPTQEANLPACRLYQGMGYSETQREFIYHYWHENSL